MSAKKPMYNNTLIGQIRPNPTNPTNGMIAAKRIKRIEQELLAQRLNAEKLALSGRYGKPDIAVIEPGNRTEDNDSGSV